MKIISKYKDYYDGGSALGIDEKVKYIRKQEVRFYKELPYLNSYYSNKHTYELELINLKATSSERSHYIRLEEQVIGFCGKLYPGIEFAFYKNDNNYKSEFFYDSKTIINFINALSKEYGTLKFTNWYNYNLEKPNSKYLDTYFKSEGFGRSYNEWFHEIKSPIFRILTPSIELFKAYKINPFQNDIKLILEVNPILKNLNFYKIKDTYSAFQEIAQFIDGVISNNEISIDKRTDIEKIESHGFDKKYGFRKRPKNK